MRSLLCDVPINVPDAAMWVKYRMTPKK